MSEASTSLTQTAEPRGFVAHAKLIGAITFISRLLGLAREVIAANFFGAGPIWSAFQYAFTIPNLFRKLLGEGALSMAFVPLYTKSIRDSVDRKESNEFASASISLLIILLIGITILGEFILSAFLYLAELRSSTQLAVKLTIVMLPYVVFICGAAFLSGILQVHRRFTAAAATSIVSNLMMIVALIAVSLKYDLLSETGQRAAVWWIALAVLLSGGVQVAMLVPSLRSAGFRFHFVRHFWTPAVKRMLWMSIPVALGAAVLQLGVVLDKQIALMLAQGDGKTHFELFGAMISLPMQEGALARLNWAQFLYQFPLGVFAIAIATAIFPQIAGDALEEDLTQFRSAIRKGIESSLFIGLPASAGMILIAHPCVRLLFERGQFTAEDSHLTAISAAIYSSAIWAFSIQQIINRAYYALHDTRTPLIWTAINLLINLMVEIPLLWTGLHESAMAVGTLVSFVVQATAMLYLLNRRVHGIDLKEIAAPVGKMLLATAVMVVACLLVKALPFYPQGSGKVIWLGQLSLLIGAGSASYFLTTHFLGLDALRQMMRTRV